MPSPNKIIIVFLGCYLAACFLPNAGSYDVMAPQFLAFGVIHFVAFLHLLFRARVLLPRLKKNLQHPLSIVAGFFLLWQLLSVIVAVNQTEAFLNAGRWFTGMMVFLHIGLIQPDDNDGWVTSVVLLLGVALLLESCYVVATYISGLGKESFSLLIYGIRGTAGNKNVLAASMALKFPFALYALHLFRDYRKHLSAFLLFLASLAIFLVNARAAILSVGLIVFLYILFAVHAYWKKRQKDGWKGLAMVSLALILSLVVSQVLLNAGLQQDNGVPVRTSYGTVFNRMKAIEFSNQSSNNRFRLWKDAMDYTRSHWLLGAGTGNWKLESIRYTSLEDNDLYVPYHAHNDFLEMAAETGIPGLLLYLSLFLLCGWKLLRLATNSSNDRIRFFSFALLFSLMAYGVDAFFNFPAERPVMQLLFWMLLAFTVVLTGKTENPSFRYNKTSLILPSFLLILSVSLVHYSYLYYRSMQLQAKLLSEYDAEPVYPSDEILEGWEKAGEFPSISAQFTLPLASMVARYHIRDGNYAEALRLIEQAGTANPYIYFNEFLKGFIYLKQAKYDTAFGFTSLAFQNRPRCKPYYKNHMTAALMVRDSLELEKTFHRYLQFRNEPYAWELYLGGLYEWNGRASSQLLQKLDNVRNQFPEDEGLKKLAVLLNNGVPGATTPANTSNLQKAAAVRKLAEDFFAKQQYAKAAMKFEEAFRLNTGDWSLKENAGLCFYATGSYQKAVQCFDEVIEKGGLTGGKSEFYKALALIQLKRSSEACSLLEKALQRGYDPAQVESYRRKHCN